MPKQRGEEGGPQRDRTKQQARAERILDAAVALVQRWGYNKTTIDDIARQAGVAKGTIYLHWKTREDLFIALLLRESLKLIQGVQQSIEDDPAGATLRGMIKHSTLALVKNPLMKALFLQDNDMLGEFANREYSSATFASRIDSYELFLKFMREHGIVSTDLGVREQTYILCATWIGFLLAERWMPAEFKFPEEEVVEMLADTVQRALEPRGAPAKPVPSKAFADTFRHYMEQQIQALKEMQKELEL